MSQLRIETDDLIPGPPPLSPQEEQFCCAYGDPESETYGKATASAALAGYVEPHNAAWKLRRRPRIQARLAQFQDVTTAAVGRVLSDLEHERQLALAKGDIASAVRASELMGKHLGMFRENIEIEVGASRAYTEAEALEAKRLAVLMLEGAGELPAAPAEPLALPVNQ